MADVITRLKIDSSEYDAKIKRAVTGLRDMEKECRSVGGTLAVLEKDQKDYVASLGRMETVNKSAKGSLQELKGAFTELSVQYKRLTDEEKRGDFGKALGKSLSDLRERIRQGSNDLQAAEREVKNLSGSSDELGGVMQMLSSKFGISTDAMAAFSAGTLGAAAGIGAAMTATIAATKALYDYNVELSKQGNITAVTTGLSGGDADALTAQARALSTTYGVDFREAINGANTLMQQFGVSSQEAMDILAKGMQGMIEGDGPKLLSMIQQYAPSFRDAGISASQLVAIINNSEGGIFTDANMNAITMGIKNLRLMTDSTSKALAKLGIDGAQMTQQLNDGTLTIFDAMQQVSTAIEKAGASSQATGEVMQAVFGRQGTAAGTNLGKAIATLNTNLDETSKQTGEVGVAMNNLYQSNVNLESQMQRTFAVDNVEVMKKELEGGMYNALSNIIGVVKDIDESLGKWSVSQKFLTKLNDAYLLIMGALKGVDAIAKWASGTGGGLMGSGGKIEGTGVAGLLPEGGIPSNTPKVTPIVTPTTTPSKGGSSSRGAGSTSAPWAAIAMNDIALGLTYGVSEASLQKSLNSAKADMTNAVIGSDEYVNAQGRVQKYTAELNNVRKPVSPFADAYSYNFKKDAARLQGGQQDRQAGGMTGSQALAGIVGNVNTMASAIEQLGVDVPDGMKDMLGGLGAVVTLLTATNAILGIIQTLSAVQATTGSIPFFSTGGVVRAAGGYANTVPGNLPYDGIPALLTSGETVFNRAQTNNLASQLDAASKMQAMVLTTTLAGENILIAINNTLKRSGKGELVTTKSSRS